MIDWGVVEDAARTGAGLDVTGEATDEDDAGDEDIEWRAGDGVADLAGGGWLRDVGAALSALDGNAASMKAISSGN